MLAVVGLIFIEPNGNGYLAALYWVLVFGVATSVGVVFSRWLDKRDHDRTITDDDGNPLDFRA